MSKRAALEEIWNEVIKRIINRMQEICNAQTPEGYHLSLKAELLLEYAKLQVWLMERIINGRDIESISIENEHEICFNNNGLEKIENTASLISEQIWMRKYRERWLPKTLKALEKEKNPKALKKLPLCKEKISNHYIPIFFLKKYWSYNNTLTINKTDKGGVTTKKICGTGQWGYRNNLYPPKLEAYFSLIEGDAEEPLRLIQDIKPLSFAQQEALVGFIVIQKIRNPHFMETLTSAMKQVIHHEQGAEKANDTEYMKVVYSSLYENNEFYAKLAKPILENIWVTIVSKEPLFILPDTFNLTGQYADSEFNFMPLTPNQCFIVLPFKDNGNLLRDDIRIFVPQIFATQDLAKKISLLQLSSVHSEYVSHPNFSPQDDSLIVDISEVIMEINSMVMKNYETVGLGKDKRVDVN